jgi:hypothetical protein
MSRACSGRSTWWRSAALATFIVVATAGCEWPMLGFGPARTNYNPFESRVNVVNVGSLQETWSTPFGGPLSGAAFVAPVVSGGVVYAGFQLPDNAEPFAVQAFDAKGLAGCSGSPTICTPEWTGATFGGPLSLAVVGGLVYAGTGGNRLFAFDAAGVQGCAGSPKKCSPLWTASSVDGAAVVVAGGFVYAQAASGDGTMYAFDAAGVENCSGTPKTCTPLWKANGGRPSVANGFVYASAFRNGAFEVRVFDANGVHGCAGTPKICTPLWTGREAGGDIIDRVTPPTIAQGLVFLGISEGDEMFTSGRLVGFDAGGVRGCSGTPKTCVAIWRAPTDGVFSNPAVAGDRLYVTDRFFTSDGITSERRQTLRAFDVDACATSRPSCRPLWTAPLQDTALSPAVANGVVYANTSDRFAAFDGAGNVNCSGAPKTCAPLAAWNVTTGASTPVITNGVVYIDSGFSKLRAYELP